MELSLVARDLLLVTWELAPRALARKLPSGTEAALTSNGTALVSLAAVRNTDVRAGGFRVPSWTQLAVRTYVEVENEEGILFLALRVTPPGLAAAVFGVPVRPARLRVAKGLVHSSGLGVSLRYRLASGAPDVPELERGPIGGHEIAYVVAAGVRRLVGKHDPFGFEAAELVEQPRVDPLFALGLDAGEPASVLYAAQTAFTLGLPPERVRLEQAPGRLPP